MDRHRLAKLFRQAVKFGLVGVINTLIDLSVFTLLTLTPFFAAYYPLAKAVSFGCGVTNSLFMNKRFTFRDGARMTRLRVITFLLINCASLGISVLCLTFCVEVLFIARPIANICATALSMGVNFAGNKLLVFKG